MPAELAIDFSVLSSLPSDVTFSRTGSAWYFDDSNLLQSAASGSPRLGRTVPDGPRGLIIEGQRTNECLYSNDMTVSAWQTFSSSSITETLNYAAGPDGTTTATRLEFTTSYGHIIQQNVTISGGTANKTITYSVWLKSNTGSSQGITLKNTHGGVVDNFVDVTVTTSWQRFQFTVNNNSSSGSGTHFVGLLNRSTSAKDILVWHNQVEQASFASTPIPTTSAAVTRNADSAKIVAADASAYLDTANGAIAASFSLSGTATAASPRVVCSFNNTTTDERHSLYASSGNAIYMVVDGGAIQAEINAGSSPAVETLALLVAGYELDNTASVLDNGTAVTDMTATMPSVTEIEFGAEVNASYLFGVLEKFKYLPTRPTNSDLETLTADSDGSISVSPSSLEYEYTGPTPTVVVTTNYEAQPASAQYEYTTPTSTVTYTDNRFANPATAEYEYTVPAPSVTFTDDRFAYPATLQYKYAGPVPTINVTGDVTVYPPTLEYEYSLPAASVVVPIGYTAEPGTYEYHYFTPIATVSKTAAMAIQSHGEFAIPVDFIAGDELILTAHGPSADAPAIRITLRFVE